MKFEFYCRPGYFRQIRGKSAQTDEMCIRDRLKEEQKLIEPQIKSLHKQISDVDCKIDEINSVIRVYNSCLLYTSRCV